jgi:cell wall-associated NlpC family hydrolase
VSLLIHRNCRVSRPMVTGLVGRVCITSGLVVLTLLIGGCGAQKYYRSQLPPTPNTKALIQTAQTQLGVPYRAGGTTPGTGFDCSGFTSWVYQQLGVRLPRQSYDQFHVGQEVKGDRLRQGDLLFFEIDKRGASHVGIYVDHGRFIHCPSTGGFVREDQLGEKHWHEHFLGARRVLP